MSGIYRIDIDNPSKPPFDKGGFIFELFLSRLQQETLATPFRNKGNKGSTYIIKDRSTSERSFGFEERF